MPQVVDDQSVSDAQRGAALVDRVPFWRALLIGLCLIPISTYFGNYAYVVVQAMLWGQTSLLRGPVFMLFAVAVANLIFRKVARRAGLRPSELLVIYSMLAISVCVSGYGQIQWLVNILPAGEYFQTKSNHYAQFLFRIPYYLVPHNKTVIDDFYRGHSTMYRADVLQDWAVPVAVWCSFIFVICWVTLCITSLVRRQWADEEKLTFPLVQLPLQIAEASAGETPFFRNRLMWGGFLIAGILESINYIHFFLPGFPSVKIKPSEWHLEQNFVSEPWSSIGTFTLAFYPFAIGIAFLLSCEASFSCAFFYLLTKLENVACSALGLDQGGGGYAQPPFVGEQGVGAFVALGVFLLWRARRPLWDACRSAWDGGLAKRIDDPYAPLSPRVAFWGGIVGMVALTAFVMAIGISFWVAIVFWVLYLLILIVLSRIFAEAGSGWVWGPLVNVHSTIFDMVGVRGLDAKTLTMFGYLDWFDDEFRDSSMPHQLEALKMGQETHTHRRQLLWGLLLAAAVSGVVAFWAYLHMYYEFGASSAKVRPALQGLGPWHLSEIARWLYHPTPADPHSIVAMGAGAVIVVALAALREGVVWWPFHPIGYVLAGTASMEYMWCPFLIAWAAKALILRYGGVKVYRQAVPFFLGLILGDYIVPTLWAFWGTAVNTQVYMSFPH